MIHPRRFLITTIILLFWGGMMGWLVYREVILPRTATYVAAQKPKLPADYWMGIYLNETERAGFVNVRSAPSVMEGVDGERLDVTARAKLNMFGFDADMAVKGNGWFAEDRKRAFFDFTLKAGPSESRVSGQLRDGLLKANFETGGVSTPFTFPVSNDMLLNLGLGGPAMNLPQLAPGQEAYLDTFDPSTMSVGKAKLVSKGEETITVAGQEVETSIIDITLGGMTTRAWVTAEQETVKAQTPMGIMLQKITPEEALQPVSPSDKMSLLDAMTVRPKGAEIKRGVAKARYRISGLPNGARVLADGAQQVEGDGIVTIASPTPGGAEATLEASERDAALTSDPMVNASDKAVKEAAREAVGDAQSDWDKAQALYRWVYEKLEKVPTLSLPAAIDVLRTRQGDCNEHTVLYVAMARAAGVPSRIAIGLTYSDTLGGFGYHAWPEVWVGQWLPMDPTLGQPIADATHIKLLNGGLDKWPILASYIGRIQIEVLEAEGAVESEKEVL